MTQGRKFLPGDRLLWLEEVQGLVPLSKSRIYELMKRGVFPRPIKVGLASVAWIEAEIINYLNQRIELRDTK